MINAEENLSPEDMLYIEALHIVFVRLEKLSASCIFKGFDSKKPEFEKDLDFIGVDCETEIFIKIKKSMMKLKKLG